MPLLDAFGSEFPKLQEAWMSALALMGAALIAGWLVGRFMYGQRIEGLKDELTRSDRRIAEYKEKLEGKSPDEAHAQIAALRAEVAELASYGLSSEAQRRLADALAGVSGNIKIVRDTDAADADRLYRQVVKIFRAAGFDVTSHTIWGIKNRPDSGVTLVHWPETDQGLVAKVKNALDVAGLDLRELVSPDGWGNETPLTIVFSSRDPDWVPAARYS